MGMKDEAFNETLLLHTIKNYFVMGKSNVEAGIRFNFRWA